MRIEPSPALELDGHHLALDAVIEVARHKRSVAPLRDGTPAHRRVSASAAWVRRTVEENARLAELDLPSRAYYGINTGFGIHAAGRPLSDPERMRQTSRKLIMSHATGVGEPLDEEIVRAAMLIRANTLARGHSGVRPVVINRLIDMLNRDITPVVPRMGSLGASGDLAPLAHLALVLSRPPESMAGLPAAPGFEDCCGEASVVLRRADQQVVGRRIVSGAEAMHWNGSDQRLVLDAKEGLALSNGATFSAAIGVLAVHDAENLVRNAEIAVALCMEALQGCRDAFLPPIHLAREHPGQIASAANIYDLLRDSRLVDAGDVDHDPERQPPQDPYSLRCAPQVIGAVREAVAAARQMLEREINAATDNPLIFVEPEDGLQRQYRAISGGNFHGEYVAFAMDFLSIALTELGSISERRVFWLLNRHMSRGLPSMLVQGDETQIDSGLMITQYVAASLVSRCKTLAHPDSVDSIPSSADQEDHVSMSMNAGLHTREIVEHITAVIAIEQLAAITAIRHRLQTDGRAESDLGTGTRLVLEAVRQQAPEIFALPLDRDVVVYPYVQAMIRVVQNATLPDALRGAGIARHAVAVSTRLVLEP